MHERGQFWPGTEMENIGQTEHIELQLKNEVWGTFTVSQIRKLNKVSDPCEEDEEYSFTECLMEFVANSTGCYLDWGQSFISANYPGCTTLQQIIDMEKLLHKLSQLSWSKLTKTSGCYGKCQYKKFIFTQVREGVIRDTTMVEVLFLQTSNERIDWKVSSSSAFFLSAEKTMIRLEEELVVFGFDDVVNGIGGALGLFLGWSILHIVLESYRSFINFARFIKLSLCFNQQEIERT